MAADGRTDKTKQIVALRNFANAPKKEMYFVSLCLTGLRKAGAVPPPEPQTSYQTAQKHITQQRHFGFDCRAETTVRLTKLDNEKKTNVRGSTLRVRFVTHTLLGPQA